VHLSNVRVFGVLQRLAVTYCIVAVTEVLCVGQPHQHVVCMLTEYLQGAAKKYPTTENAISQYRLLIIAPKFAYMFNTFLSTSTVFSFRT